MSNKATLTSDGVPSGVTFFGVTAVGNTTLPVLEIQKITTSPTTVRGRTARYTIVLRNLATGRATDVQIDDFLPTAGGTAVDPTLRFNFGATSSLAAGGVITLAFTASAGSNLAFSPPPYTHHAVGRITTNTLVRADTNAAAPVSINRQALLSITKTNGTPTVMAGATTVYTVVAGNAGPDASDGAVLKEVGSAGLFCTATSCPAATPTGGATCPAARMTCCCLPEPLCQYFLPIALLHHW